MADGYGLADTSTLVDAVLRRQAENHDAALARSRSAEPRGVRIRARVDGLAAPADRWLRAHADEFRALLR